LNIHSNRVSAGRNPSQPRMLSFLPRHLLGRLFLFAGLLAPAILLLASTPHSASLLGALAPLGIVSYAVFVGLGYSHFKLQQQDLPFSARFFLLHLACILLVSFANVAALYGFGSFHLSEGVQLALRIVLLVGIALLALACIPLHAWISAIRETRRLWLYSVVTGLFAWCLRFPLQSLWDSASTAPGRILQVLTFHSVQAVLRFFLPNISVNADTFTIGTPRFSIIVAEACSGLEGLGLVLAFTVLWLIYFRRESRFPQAILLIPCALASVWMLNILRISALVLIGNAGYSEVAMVGFHSQAGWIAFTTVAFGFSMATRKLPWVRRYYYIPASVGNVPAEPVFLDEGYEQSAESPATAVYLVPFLAILAASFLSKAVSGYFEWLYPLRFIAAAIAIWYYWPEFRSFDWRLNRSSWIAAPLTGAAVFLIWLAPTFWGHPHPVNPLGATLATLSPTARWVWIAFRIAAAVLTVPIAEELAFRGYLARRLVNREFDSIPFSAATAISIGLSSVVFGLMHGQEWIVGILAGLAYAAVMKWKGRLSDAIVAHATTNLLLAIWVISRGDWGQW
jgi:exosortase E/protease (VPEID-CTERM system)